ncbi:MAG: hypothetical protein B7Y25_00730 [Alphaproteobacteria bacterium 16-39-46]|nr:MAG: hypothetical protein B7Y25_00730 [Alphaproteobacteria bacterium 16-39-46]OZA44365.1 MAG: hypothetical protein B7X84_00735 [Alphaproteobacteria bacterium 17-39-52]HQS83433.1 hypothetical protein [Alphaproteobacteria bacterium]HQS93197.1 hypothetical protein [Alphaproteobacteria bacterium]
MFIKKSFLLLSSFLLISPDLYAMESDRDLEGEKNKSLSKNPLKLSPSKYISSRSFESPEEEKFFLRTMIHEKKYAWLLDDQRDYLLEILNKDNLSIFEESPHAYSERLLGSSRLTYSDFVQGRRMVLFSNALYSFEIKRKK